MKLLTVSLWWCIYVDRIKLKSLNFTEQEKRVRFDTKGWIQKFRKGKTGPANLEGGPGREGGREGGRKGEVSVLQKKKCHYVILAVDITCHFVPFSISYVIRSGLSLTTTTVSFRSNQFLPCCSVLGRAGMNCFLTGWPFHETACKVFKYR